jgi:mediator of RNA polymerase II transcription subunit 15
MIPSPIGGQPRGGPGSLAPSPSSQVNTPLNQPASQEEREYLEKVKQLEKYIEPLRKMIFRIGNDDNEKLAKMKKLLDIMSNPDKRMPLATLQKCEDVLKRMQLDTTESDQSEGGGGADKNPLLEAIMTVRQSSRAAAPNLLNNTLARTFLPPMQAVLGPEICLPPLPPSPPPVMETDEVVSDLLQGEVARLDPRFRVWLSGTQPSGQAGDMEIVCQLGRNNYNDNCFSKEMAFSSIAICVQMTETCPPFRI